MNILASNGSEETVKQTTDIFQRVSHNYINGHSLLVLFISLAAAALLGRIAATGLRRVVWAIGRRADKSENLRTVNRLRRYETYLVLSIAVLRTLFFLFALYFWWVFIHPTGQPTAILGASAIAAIFVGGVLGPVLRDLASGSFMMAEQWYGVGDFIQILPFKDLEGIVERVTLRSTRIRSLNGEIIWVNNQNIQGVRLTPRGTRTLALEIFVDDEAAGKKLLERANKRLPIGPLLVVTPPTVVSSEKVGDSLWHITAVGETAPGREWLLERSAVELIKSLDDNNKQQVIAHGPLFRYADRDAEQSFNRTIKNSRKRPTPKKRRSNKSKSTSAKTK